MKSRGFVLEQAGRYGGQDGDQQVRPFTAFRLPGRLVREARERAELPAHSSTNRRTAGLETSSRVNAAGFDPHFYVAHSQVVYIENTPMLAQVAGGFGETGFVRIAE
jgi:hypothetical protein